MSEHTPGPLVASGRYIYKDIECESELLPEGICLGVAKSAIVPVARGVRGHDVTQARANARLWAAAPDLLAACVAVLADVYDDHQTSGAIAKVRAAIAKAKGGAA